MWLPHYVLPGDSTMPYNHFTSDERDVLQVLMSYKLDTWMIARILGKHSSSVYRELSRNEKSGFYLSHHASFAAQERRKISRTSPKRGNVVLIREIERRIREDHSPEQIAGRMKLDYSNQPSWHISYETIYQHLYDEVHKGSDLGMHLRQGHKKRHKRLSSKDRRGIIPNRHFIDERPAIVKEKTRLGDWEGDTVEGGRKKGYVGTFVDRASKYLIAFPLKRKTTTKLVLGARHAFAKIPANRKKTVTVDNGKEFTNHTALATAIGAKVFFAHPYHSWERGLNEHSNGMLRQYLPKKMPLDKLTHKQLAKIVMRLNTRPRKSLGYRTPQEVFFKPFFALQI
jgi:transposase, IS30 family